MRALTMAEQELAMLRHRSFVRTGRRPWAWRGTIQTRPGGQTYVVDLVAGQRSGQVIKVWVREPALVPYGTTGRPPHAFSDGSMCFSDRVATSSELIAETTVPWVYSWFYFYERWVETGIWFGPEAPGHELDRTGNAAAPVKTEPKGMDETETTRDLGRSRADAA